MVSDILSLSDYLTSNFSHFQVLCFHPSLLFCKVPVSVTKLEFKSIIESLPDYIDFTISPDFANTGYIVLSFYVFRAK